MAHCTKVKGLFPEGEQKAQKNTCFARSALNSEPPYDDLFALVLFCECVLTSNGEKEDDRDVVLGLRNQHRLLHHDPRVGHPQRQVASTSKS